MKRAHQDQLECRLEEVVATQGWTTIRDEELRLWYGQKVTKNVWRDINSRLEALAEEYPQKYKREVSLYHYDGNILIVEASDDGPLTPITQFL
tara:strand:- start:2835 stop:3113 length:279 start_codon:yes stop_codon:yes gene_type:complete